MSAFAPLRRKVIHSNIGAAAAELRPAFKKPVGAQLIRSERNAPTQLERLLQAPDSLPSYAPAPVAPDVKPASGQHCTTVPLRSRAKLEVNPSDGALELRTEPIRESDMRMELDGSEPESAGQARDSLLWRSGVIQRACSRCADGQRDEESLAQRSTDGAPALRSGHVSADWVARFRAVQSSGGEPLPGSVRSLMQPRLGASFENVRVHRDETSSLLATQIGARAFTVDRDVFFKHGEYAPGSRRGQRLLAHELAHVVQQSKGFWRSGMAESGGSRELEVGREDDSWERDADRVADLVMAAGTDRRAAHTSGVGVAALANEGSNVIRRQSSTSEDAETEEPVLTRAEEIALSRSTPGFFTGDSQPLALSLYNFGIDISDPKAEHVAVLTELGALLRALATGPITVRIIGFADATGDERYNLRLSQRRANAVKRVLEQLVSQRIAVTAYGETNPVASNETVSGRTRNRRVDIRLASTAPPPAHPLPRPRPTPPGTTPPAPQPPGQQPPTPQPPGGGGSTEEHDFCTDYPLLCGLGNPFFLPLICVVAPELCLAAGCVLDPARCIPPIWPPPEPPDEPGEPPEEEGAPRVTFVPDVRAANTPSGMNDRIGIRDPVAVTALVTNPPPATSPITIDVDGNGPNSGVATVNGQSRIQIVGSTQLTVQGVSMTREGFPFSPYLQLAAWWSNDLVGASNRFAVSSIAEDWSVALDEALVTRSGYAFYTHMDWLSDSGGYRDLGSLYYVELVDVESESGGMAGMGAGVVDDPADPNTADLHPAIDQHGTEHAYTRRAGSQVLKQLWRIRDARSNSGWSPARNSGFEILRRFERDPNNPRCFRLVVEKRGADVTIGSMSSSAGSGSAEHTFRNINCDPPPPPQQPPTEPTLPPEPEPGPPPAHEPPEAAPSTRPCDRAELSRRVDECIDEARQGAIDCTLGVNPFSGGWGGVEELLEYYNCLEQVRRNLLECDRRAKEDTNCPDAPAPEPPPPPPPAPTPIAWESGDEK